MIKHIAGALPIVAKMLASVMNVEVRFGGNTACTDSKIIWIPHLPLSSVKAAVLAFGYLVHEAAHILYSDFTLKYSGALHKNIGNILEDIRIETKIRMRFQGAKSSLYNLVTHLVTDGKMGHVPDGTNPVDVVLMYMLYRLRATCLGHDQLDQSAVECEALLKTLMPEDLLNQVNAEMFKVTSCQSEQEVYDLSMRIVNMLQSAQEEAQNQANQPQAQPQQEDQQDGQTGQGENQDQDDQQGEEDQSQGGSQQNVHNQEENQEAEGDQSQGGSQQTAGNPENDQDTLDGQDENQDQSGHSDNNGSQGQQDAGDPTKPEQSGAGESDGGKQGQQALADKLSQILNEQSNVKTDLGEVVEDEFQSMDLNLNDDGSASHTVMSQPISNGQGQGASAVVTAQALTRTRTATNALRFRMDQLIETYTMSHERRASTGRRVDMNRSWDMKVGNTRIFRKRVEGHDVDTAIFILLDRSGSMDDKISLATDACLSLALSLQNVEGAKVACGAFPGPNEEQHLVQMLTRFDERVSGTARHYANLQANGYTPLANALLYASSELLSEKAERRILFVVTDGQPDNVVESKKILKALPELEIETLGLGINIDISQLFSESRKIDSIQSMPGAVFEMLEQAMGLKFAA